MRIPVYSPNLLGNERRYVDECIDSTWISSRGDFVQRFEQKFAQYIDARHATSVANGTVALHLALTALGIGAGDEVLVPAFTYIASVNTIAQTGAIPVFVDSRLDNWQVDPDDMQRKLSPRTRAVMAVHLYGHPCDMAEISRFCATHNLHLIEDCAEALGAHYEGRHVGTFGDIATFSFFGNKTITTGEGGMVVCGSSQMHDRCAKLKNQGVAIGREYWHDEMAYNYRMTNVCAAIGVAQLERVDEIVAKKRRIASWYQEGLADSPVEVHRETSDKVVHSYWMNSILVPEPDQREPLRGRLRSMGIETRPAFFPVHLFPMYHRDGERHPVAESLGARGINLPSGSLLTHDEVREVTDAVCEFMALA